MYTTTNFKSKKALKDAIKAGKEVGVFAPAHAASGPARDGIEYNAHIDGDGRDIFEAACKLGHEGIVAKRRDLPYQSGRSKWWLKTKNPNSRPTEGSGPR